MNVEWSWSYIKSVWGTSTTKIHAKCYEEKKQEVNKCCAVAAAVAIAVVDSKSLAFMALILIQISVYTALYWL